MVYVLDSKSSVARHVGSSPTSGTNMSTTHIFSGKQAQLPKLIAVIGPTAVGKSDMAVEIALALKARGQKAEIISADSRQIYMGLNIGAGKITKKEMKGVLHHCLDILSPKRKKLFSVAEFQTHAFKAIDGAIAGGAIPILCGGTGFYIDAIVDGIVLPEVKTDPELRKKLETYSTEKLVQTLAKLDADRLAEIDQHNRVRLIRSIEIAKTLGKVPMLIRNPKYDTLQIGLDMPKDDLMHKVHARVAKRLKQGMVAEAKNLHADGVSWKRMKQLGLEYGLLADLLQNKLTREQFIERLKIETWQYAKRQHTWFYKKEGIKWFEPKDTKKIVGECKGFLGFKN